MKDFYFLTHDNTNPEFNLASEEYLLKQKDGYYIYLWVNAPAVIVGINQNAVKEVNLAYTEQNGIKVIRRLTGGGTVYHDTNNLCYTFIAPYDEKVDNYKKFTAPIIEYLNSIGIKAEFSGRNDITVDGKKISGNAQTVYKDRIMHHGTILLNTDMEVLEKAIRVNQLKIKDKGINSNRARVTNVLQLTDKVKNAKEFKKGLSNHFLKSTSLYQLTEEDINKINLLVKEKYSKFDWNIGASPKGSNYFENKFDFGIFEFSFDTEKGKIKNAKITGDFFSVKDISEFAENLNGKEFKYSEMKKAFSNIDKYIKNAKGDEIVDKILK